MLALQGVQPRDDDELSLKAYQNFFKICPPYFLSGFYLKPISVYIQESFEKISMSSTTLVLENH